MDLVTRYGLLDEAKPESVEVAQSASGTVKPWL
jgi:hypothetical protein